jgi:predicted DNA-binding protein with PD1-like motif
MLITRAKDQRTFMGRLNYGDEIPMKLQEVLHQNKVECGLIRAQGLLDDPRVRVFSEETTEGETIRQGSGRWELITCEGNISYLDGELDTSLKVLLSRGGELLAGRLVGASVAQLEFYVRTLDDFILIRGEEEQSGLMQWVQVRFPEDESSAPEPLKRPASRRRRVGLDDDENPEIEEGDVLLHPRFKRCTVLKVIDDEKVTVRLPTGRRVELILSMFKLEPKEEQDGATVYNVTRR